MKFFSAFLAVFFMVLLYISSLLIANMDSSLYIFFGCLTAAAVYQFAVLDSIYKLFKDESKQKVSYNALNVITIPPEFGSGNARIERVEMKQCFGCVELETGGKNQINFC
jgi:hypothetical protein